MELKAYLHAVSVVGNEVHFKPRAGYLHPVHEPPLPPWRRRILFTLDSSGDLDIKFIHRPD
jgi:hypothetical protein